MIPDDIELLRVPGPPAISPDGAWVVFSVQRPDLAVDDYVGGLWRGPVDGHGDAVPFTRGHRDVAPTFSPDGRMLAFLRTEHRGRAQLYVVEASGGEPVRLTDAPLGVSEPQFSPDGSRLAFLARVPEPGRYERDGDPGGEPARHVTTLSYRANGTGFLRDKPQHLFVLDVPRDLTAVTGHEPTAVQLTQGDLEVNGPRWMPDGRHLLAVSAVHEGRDEDLRSDVVLVSASPGDVLEQPRALTGLAAATASEDALSVSAVLPGPDGHRIWVLASDVGPTGRDFVAASTALYSIDLEVQAVVLTVPGPTTPELTVPELEPDARLEGDAAGGPSTLDEADDSGNAAAERDDAAELDDAPERDDALERDDAAELDEPHVPGPVLARGADPDAPYIVSPPRRLTDPAVVDLDGFVGIAGSEVLLTETRRGGVTLRAVRDDGRVRTLLTARAVVQGGAVSKDGRRVVVAAAGPATSGDIHVLELGSGAVRTLTDLSAPLRDTGRVRVAIERTVTGEDGYPVHGWVALPDADRFGAGPHPSLLLIHGGPHTQYTHALFDEVQVAVEAGYAVVYANPRGSAGYGAAHGRAIKGAFGTVDAQDVMTFLDAAVASPELHLDPARVGVMGGSYGGYLSAWLTTQTDRFAAAIVERGFLDPVSFVGSSDIGWFFGLEYLGDAGTDQASADAVAAQSPMAHVGDVHTPTLVIHSEQDWRCPIEQGQRWYVELKRRGVPAELVLFPGENHDLSRTGRPSHRKQRFEHVLRWWAHHLPVDAEGS